MGAQSQSVWSPSVFYRRGWKGFRFVYGTKNVAMAFYAWANMKIISTLVLLPADRFPGEHGGLRPYEPDGGTWRIIQRSASQLLLLCQAVRNRWKCWQKKWMKIKKKNLSALSILTLASAAKQILRPALLVTEAPVRRNSPHAPSAQSVWCSAPSSTGQPSTAEVG